jgi:hypothetical protein
MFFQGSTYGVIHISFELPKNSIRLCGDWFVCGNELACEMRLMVKFEKCCDLSVSLELSTDNQTIID